MPARKRVGIGFTVLLYNTFGNQRQAFRRATVEFAELLGMSGEFCRGELSGQFFPLAFIIFKAGGSVR